MVERNYTIYLVARADKYDISAENNEFKVRSRDIKDGREIYISFETLKYNSKLVSTEDVIEEIQVETAAFFENEKVKCYPKDIDTLKAIKKIAMFNKQEFNSCDSE